MVDVRFNVPPHAHRTWMFESSPQSLHLLSIDQRPQSFWQANGFSFQFQPHRWPDGRIDHDLKILTPWWTWAALFSLLPATSLCRAVSHRAILTSGCPRERNSRDCRSTGIPRRIRPKVPHRVRNREAEQEQTDVPSIVAADSLALRTGALSRLKVDNRCNQLVAQLRLIVLW